MSEYIKKEDALKVLEEHKHSMEYCSEHNIDFCIDMGMVRILLNDLPTYSFPNSAENKGDLISRQAVLDALKEHRALYCDNTPDTFSKLSYAEKSRVDELDTAIATIINLPSVENKGEFDGMNNGEVIISLYPNLKYIIQNGRVVTTIGVASSFDLDWWNAPYKAESEE